MHAERDHLVKVVFPALRERLEKHRVHLIDIDLRWGVTREQAENDQVLDLCLQQIDECRPFFLGILGERYGWVPTRYPADALKKYGWIQHHTGKSVTELEILHGVLQKPAWAAARSSTSAILPLSTTFRRNRRRRPGGERERPREINSAEGCHPPRRSSFHAGGKLSLHVSRLAHQCAAGSRRADRSTAPHAAASVAGDGIVDPDEYAALDATLRDYLHRHATVYLGGLQQFGKIVQEQLWAAIRNQLQPAENPLPRGDGEDDRLAADGEAHQAFIESRRRVFT